METSAAMFGAMGSVSESSRENESYFQLIVLGVGSSPVIISVY